MVWFGGLVAWWFGGSAVWWFGGEYLTRSTPEGVGGFGALVVLFGFV